PIPGGARLAYIFGSGLLFIFISQVITGLCLALYYVPSAQSAHTSVAYITKQVAAGQFLRSLHYYGSSAMIIVLLLHFLQTFIYGSFKGRRELLWISGAFLSLLVLGMGFTGYLLPWDQSAYFATAVGTNIIGEVPFIGQWLTDMLRGGDTLGTLTLSRFYFAHVFLIPGMIFLFIGIHIALFRKAGPAGPIKEDPVNPKLPPESFYPRQVIMDMAFALLIMIGLGFLAYFHPVQLGPIADPSNTKFVPRPEWYYLPMFEWLKFWSSRMEVFAVVLVPAILALLFFLIPFLDRKLERRPWRRPIPLLSVAIVLVGMIFLGFKSHLDDLRDHSVAIQLAFQDKQDRDYTKTPFHPRLESVSGQPLSSGPANPLVAKGKGIFDSQGCSGCHGDSGAGTATAPSLVGITSKYPLPQLTNLLQHPNAQMVAGHMPAFNLSAPDMTALFGYMDSLGKSGGSAPAAATPSEAPPNASATSPAPTPATAKAPKGSAPPAKGVAGATSASVASGEKFFQAHGCAGCHGTAGAGTASVSAMAGLIAKHSDAQLTNLLHTPDAKMRAGGMQPLVAPPAQVSSLIAYLRSLAPATSAKAKKEASTVVPAQNAAGQKEAAPASTPSTATPPATKTSSATASKAAPVKPGAAAKSTAIPAGRAIFVSSGCAACHGGNGQGASAPSLIGITRKYPPAQLTNLLRHPSKAMRDGSMPAVTASDPQMKQLVAYLSSLGAAPSTNSNPASPGAQPATAQSAPGPGTSTQTAGAAKKAKPVPLSAEAVRGKAVFENNSCQTCHGVGGLHGTVAARGLAGTASLLPAPVLENLLRHHSKQMQKGGMPLDNMNTQDMNDIVAYIRSMPSPASSQ
ncbi:MAG: cytochrome b N-terminal domain-containing protein, partial [Acidobacteriaceae bacterium]